MQARGLLWELATGRVLFAVTTVTLLWPRLKDYAYIAFLPPAAWLARDLFERAGVLRWLVVGCGLLMVVGRELWNTPPVDQPATAVEVVVACLPWLLALGLWVCFALHLGMLPQSKASAGAPKLASGRR